MTREGEPEEIRAAPGIVEVRLAESPTTGFTWRLSSATAGVVEAGSEYTPADPSAVGGGGTRVFRLQIDAPGRYAVEFLLGRSWLNEAVERKPVVIVVG